MVEERELLSAIKEQVAANVEESAGMVTMAPVALIEEEKAAEGSLALQESEEPSPLPEASIPEDLTSTEEGGPAPQEDFPAKVEAVLGIEDRELPPAVEDEVKAAQVAPEALEAQIEE